MEGIRLFFPGLYLSFKPNNMKKYLLLLSIPAMLFACKGNENNANTAATDSAATAAPADTTTAPATAAQYTCPMHPDVLSDKPGQCPQCGMELQVKS